jgi:flagellar protein FliL
MSNESSASQAAETPASKPRRLPLVLALVVGITVGGMGASLIVRPLGAEKGATGECSCDGQGSGGDARRAASRPLHTVSDLVLNPASSGGTRFLMLSVAFSANDDSIVQKMQERDLEVRDALLKVLGAKTVSELSDVGARPALKDEVKEKVGTLFGAHAVHDVFFPQFVIQ